MQLLFFVSSATLLATIVLVYWFWSRKVKSISLDDDDAIDILVDDGAFFPSNIYLTVGLPATLRFFRRDPNPAAQTVSFQGFITNYNLPLNKHFELEFTPEEVGELSFNGQSDPYRGRIIVVNAASSPV